MAINKVVYGDSTLIDLTLDTVIASKVMSGYTFHDRSGLAKIGTASSGGGGDWSYIIVVKAPAGSQINVIGNEESYTHISDGNDYAFSVYHKNTTYTVSATIDGLTNSKTIITGTDNGVIDYVELKFGTINLTINSQLLNKNIVCKKGTQISTRTATSLSMVIRVPSTGVWDLEGWYAQNEVFTNSVVVSDLDVPVSVKVLYHAYGDTVTPTDDIDTWLSCIGVYDSTYTTLLEVLADEDLLKKLLTDSESSELYQSSIAYMIRSTTWAETICNNAPAFLYLSSLQDTLDAIEEDVNWNNAYQASGCISSASLVPIMTSNTTPSGECFANSESSDTYAAYKAFDDNSSSTYWTAASADKVPCYVGYHFDIPVYVDKVKLQVTSTSYTASEYKIQGSNDGENWTDISDVFTTNISASLKEYAVTPSYYSYYRLYISTLAQTSAARIRHFEIWSKQVDTTDLLDMQEWLRCAGIKDKYYESLADLLNDLDTLLQLMSSQIAVDYLVEKTDWINNICNSYNAMLAISWYSYAIDTLTINSQWVNGLFNSEYMFFIFKDVIPIMTSDTEPSGECFVTDGYTPSATYAAYKAFDKILDSYARLIASSLENYIGYDFGEENEVKAFGFSVAVAQTNTSSISNNRTYKIQGSNDKTNWTDLAIFEKTSSTSLPDNLWKGVINNPDYYRYYRVWFSEPIYSSSSAYVREFDIYTVKQVIDGDKYIIRSAAYDTVYMYDNEDNLINLCTTDSNGYGYILKQNLPPDIYVLYSSVARDLSDLSKDYSKVIQITQNTDYISVMPERVVYWYGVEVDLFVEEETELASYTIDPSYVQRYANGLGLNRKQTVSSGASYSYQIGAICNDIELPYYAYQSVRIIYSSNAKTRLVWNNSKTVISGSGNAAETLESSNRNMVQAEFIRDSNKKYLQVYNNSSESVSTPAPVIIHALWFE